MLGVEACIQNPYSVSVQRKKQCAVMCVYVHVSKCKKDFLQRTFIRKCFLLMLRIVYCVKQYIIWHNNFFKEHTQIADEVDLAMLLRVQQKHLRSCFSR